MRTNTSTARILRFLPAFRAAFESFRNQIGEAYRRIVIDRKD